MKKKDSEKLEWLKRNKKAQELVRRGLEDAKAGKVKRIDLKKLKKLD